MIELNKKDKKNARQIIEKGLQKEFAKGLYYADSILHDWKENVKDNRESYLALYKTVKDFDKHIASRYNDMTGSKYLLIIAAQFQDGVIEESDLRELSEDARQTIINIFRLWTKVKVKKAEPSDYFCFVKKKSTQNSSAIIYCTCYAIVAGHLQIW